MSRIGKLPIIIPDSVKVDVDGGHVEIEGPKGKLSYDMPERTSVEFKENTLIVSRVDDSAKSKAMHGLSRSLLSNMVKGVADGFVRRLALHGVGYRAAIDGKELSLNLGYSHTIRYPIPETIDVKVEDNVRIIVEGADKQLVGEVASKIRAFHPPEPYKGKGVRYWDEEVERKEGKTVQ
ncbi:MAG: 50S ribosomal protein L6 [Verrucomicrobia bacterium]|nr:50S ribosomal protein L6 [Verrucomicrobiota bacterium]MCF7707830.1 50S ribosomal protein L6 [Verrucomicrobiota bacterium]